MNVLKLIKIVTKTMQYKLRIVTECRGSRHVDVHFIPMTSYQSAIKIGQNIAKRGATVDVVNEYGNFMTHIETKLEAA